LRDRERPRCVRIKTENQKPRWRCFGAQSWSLWLRAWISRVNSAAFSGGRNPFRRKAIISGTLRVILSKEFWACFSFSPEVRAKASKSLRSSPLFLPLTGNAISSGSTLSGMGCFTDWVRELNLLHGGCCPLPLFSIPDLRVFFSLQAFDPSSTV